MTTTAEREQLVIWQEFMVVEQTELAAAPAETANEDDQEWCDWWAAYGETWE